MIIKTSLISFVCVIVCCCFALIGEQFNHTNSQISHFLDLTESIWNFRGTVLIAKEGQIVFARGYGMADAEMNQRNTVQTIFRLASITKTFTATAIMQLQEHGLLNINDPIGKYVPNFSKKIANTVTIRHLLNHTSGMLFREAEVPFGNLSSASKEIPKLAKAELEFEPGTCFHYSNMGYILLGAIIEKVSGLSYEEYLQRYIFDPLSMHSAGYGAIHTEKTAAGYYMAEGEIKKAPPIGDSYGLSAGGIYSTIEDLLLWDKAFYSDDLLSQSSRDAMFEDAGSHGYGLGWEIGAKEGHRCVGHSGGGHGFISRISRYVDDKTSIIILCNQSAAPVEAIEKGLVSILFKLPYDLPRTFEIIPIDPSKLNSYVGKYQDAHSIVFHVKAENGRLFLNINDSLNPNDSLDVELLAISKTDFLVKDSLNTIISFELDKNGNAIKLIHDDGGEEIPFNRL